MAAKLLNLFALSTLALLLCSFAPSQTFAVSVHGNHLAARHAPNHHGLAKKKRKRDNCKPRPSSSPAPSPQPNTTSNQNNNSGSNNNNVNTNSNNGNNNNNGNGNYNTPSPSSSSTSSSSTPPASTPSNTPTTTTPSGPGKLGIAWAMGDDPRIQLLLASSRVKIFHLWTAIVPDSVKNSGLPVSIMLWSTSADRVATFQQYAQPGYATHAYGMNEVNEPTQAYTSVSDAISAWYSYIRPLANQGYTLGSPCTTSAPDGFDWVTSFFQQCGSDCHVDEVPIHWYDVKFTDFQTYVEKWSDAFKKPIRITEFACQNFNGGDQPSMDDIWSFTTQAIAWLESYDNVHSYAPFGFMDDLYNVNPNDGLFSGNTLSALGWKYVQG